MTAGVLDLYSDAVRSGWPELMTTWATSDPFEATLGDFPVLVVPGYEAITHVMRNDARSFAVLPPPGVLRGPSVFLELPVVATESGAAHARLRRLIQPAFGKNGLGFSPESIGSTVDQVIDDVEAGGGDFDAKAFTTTVAHRVILRDMLGFDEEMQAVFTRMADKMEQFYVVGLTAEYRAAFDDAVEAATRIVREYQSRPRDDFIGRMVAGHSDEDDFTDAEIVGNVFGICSGAIDLTGFTTAGLLLNKARNPEQFALLEKEPELVAPAFEESLRLHPFGLFVRRFAHVGAEINGQDIREGTFIAAFVAAANRDPERFPDPDRFDIRREPRQILTFGRGIHACVGAAVGRRVGHTILARLIERHPRFGLRDPDFVPSYPSIHTLCPEALPMRLEP